jgi:hypothetical protein
MQVREMSGEVSSIDNSGSPELEIWAGHRAHVPLDNRSKRSANRFPSAQDPLTDVHASRSGQSASGSNTLEADHALA